MIISSIGCTCLVLGNVDKNVRERLWPRKKNSFIIRDYPAAHLKHFNTHLGGQWMPLALGRCQASDGGACNLCWVHSQGFQSNGMSLWSMPSCISNPTVHMCIQVLHPSNCCPSSTCWFTQHVNWISVKAYCPQVNENYIKSLHCNAANPMSGTLSILEEKEIKQCNWIRNQN